MTYKRVLLKLSGEALMGDKPYGIDPAIVQSIAEDVSKVVENKVQLAIVVGGGNIFRGISASSSGMDRSSADYTGMMATVINSLILQNSIEQKINLVHLLAKVLKVQLLNDLQKSSFKT